MTAQIVLRDYQAAAVDSIFNYFYEHDGNPIAALPTGTGKAILIGELVRRAVTSYPGTRIMMLTHVKELIEQNFKTLLRMWPTAPAGIYSAGVGRRDHKEPIIFGGIQSVYRNADLFGHIDLLLVDECHLISPKGSTMYRGFIETLRAINPKIKVIGFSATPFRLGQGLLTDKDGLFTDICFDLTSRDSFNWLISQGLLCPVIPKRTVSELDVTGVRIQGGEFVLADLQEHVDRETVTIAALEEAIRIASDRKHWLIFASGIEHAKHIASFLNDRYEIPAVAVHSKMSKDERNQAIKDFKSGKLQVLVNNNILTTGFDFPEIDCIVMLRPTASPALWVQMLGRGTRPAPGKNSCLVLDFAGNTRRLGPINDPVLPRPKGKGPAGMAPVRLCDVCGCYSHASCRFCENPDCGVEFPRKVKIESSASLAELIAGIIPPTQTLDVTQVVYGVHKKPGRPDSMRVDYYCGLSRYSEFIMLDHGGYSARLARQWWQQRIPNYRWGVPPDTHAGMKATEYLMVPTKIRVIQDGKKHFKVCGYEFD